MNQPLLILALLAALSCCATSPAQQSRSTTTVQQSMPGHSQLVISGDHGAVTVTVGPSRHFTVVRDGKELPADQVRREGDHLRVLDESGATLYDIRVLPGGGMVYPYDAKVAAGRWSGMEALAGYYASETPRKIIGVMVDPVEGALASQLGLEPESAFVIGSVSAGLPAEKAGLQPHDVIVSIQGEQPATVELLRETLDAKQPGETIKLGLLRKGQRMDVDVGIAEEQELQYRPSLDYAGAMELAESLNDRQVEMAEARDRLAEVENELREAERALAEARQEAGADSEEARERRADVEELRAEMALQEEHLRSSAAAMELLDLGSGGRALVLPPNASGWGMNVPDARLDGVDDRLRSMEERLSRLEELLTKLVESDTAKK